MIGICVKWDGCNIYVEHEVDKPEGVEKENEPSTEISTASGLLLANNQDTIKQVALSKPPSLVSQHPIPESEVNAYRDNTASSGSTRETGRGRGLGKGTQESIASTQPVANIKGSGRAALRPGSSTKPSTSSIRGRGKRKQNNRSLHLFGIGVDTDLDTGRSIPNPGTPSETLLNESVSSGQSNAHKRRQN
ncbi:hypothetical protein PTKIN_Ptkin11bG0093100 [Pterospermum kingtungense]